MLRVVTCCAVPASVFLTVQDSDSASSWYGEGATLWTWIIIAAVSTLVLGGLICLFYRTYLSCRRKHCEQEALVTCHLCTRRVPASSWRQGRAPRTPAPTSPCQCRDTCHVSSVLGWCHVPPWCRPQTILRRGEQRAAEEHEDPREHQDQVAAALCRYLARYNQQQCVNI